MFKRMKLKSYLLTVFGAIILLAGVITAVGAAGLVNAGKNMDELVNRTLAADAAVKTCRIEGNSAAIDLREMVITDNKKDYVVFRGKINENIRVINQQIAIFKSTYGEKDGLARQYEDAFKAWFAIADKIMDQLDRDDKAGATKTILEECSPALEKMGGIAKSIDDKTTQAKLKQQKHTTDMIRLFSTVSIVIFAIVLVISLFFAVRTTLSITGTVNKLKEAVLGLSRGNMKSRVDYEADNEFGELAERMNFSFQELSRYIEAIGSSMEEFSKGNFDYYSSIEFLGDFARIKESIESFQSNMNNALSELHRASDQVHAGAGQVADAASALAQGTSRQSASVVELSSSIEEISGYIANTAEYSDHADALGKKAGEVVRRSQTEMKQMLDAIKDISASSSNIQKIIKVIDDIAFQTNILALNAAVEAARAGNAGKGFAVVADEVRSLAQKSAEAAQNTTELIENSISHVKRGEDIAVVTDAAFDEVARDAGEILKMIDKITLASQEQSSSISRISHEVDQISSVVQMNSATSEESAAASQELSGQAEMIRNLLSRFRLTGRSGGSFTPLE